MTRQEAESLGWVFSLIGDAVGGLRVDRPAASKRFPEGNVRDVAGVDESQVLAAIQHTEASEAQLAANRELAARRAAEGGDAA